VWCNVGQYGGHLLAFCCVTCNVVIGACTLSTALYCVACTRHIHIYIHIHIHAYIYIYIYKFIYISI